MGLLDKAKKMAEKAGPLIDKAAPHARTVADKAGQQIDKRTGGKYHDKIEQAEQKVGEYADKRMGASGTGPAVDERFPPTPPPATFPPTTDNLQASTPTAAGTPPDTTPPTDIADAGSAETPPPAPAPDAPSDRPTS